MEVVIRQEIVEQPLAILVLDTLHCIPPFRAASPGATGGAVSFFVGPPLYGSIILYTRVYAKQNTRVYIENTLQK